MQQNINPAPARPLVSIGYGNFVAAGRVVAVISPDSAPVKRMVSEARENRTLVDATCGRRTRAVIVTNSAHIILSALMAETVANRLNGKEIAANGEEDE